MAELILHPGADAEMREAAEWYDGAREGLGQAFVEAVEQAWREIQRWPAVGVHITRQHRSYIVRRFPYAVIYTVAPEAIYIVAIAHHGRKPRYWRGRRF